MSQETERYQLENNGNTYLVRTTAGSGGADVEANPEGEATADLTKLKVDDTIYGIPEGTEVVANPTLAGTESALTGLQVGDTKYKVPEGYEIHSYTAKSYSTSDSDFTQLKNDIINCMPIKVGNYVYTCNSLGSGYHTYTSIYNTSTDFIDVYSYSLFAVDATTSISLAIPIDMRLPKVTTVGAFTSNSRTYGISIGGSTQMVNAIGTRLETTAPTANNPDANTLRFVVLTSEPATYYDGYYYIIAPST